MYSHELIAIVYFLVSDHLLEDDDHDVILHHNEYLLPSNVDNLESEEMTSTKNGKRYVAIRTRDLINWSFQIACGMNHLANKKVCYIKCITYVFFNLFHLIQYTLHNINGGKKQRMC